MDQNTIKNLADLLSFHVIAMGIFILFCGWAIVKLLDFLSDKLNNRFPRYRLQISRVFPIARLITWTVAIYISIVDVIASAGLAIGLAAQDTVRNIMSGILILFDQPFRVGDMIRIGEHYGEVIRIDTRNTRIRTFDDNIVSFPNGLVWTQAVANSNSGNLDEMVVTTIYLPAYIDTQLVKNIAWEAAASCPYVYLRKDIKVVVDDVFDRSFLTRFSVKCYVIDVRYERLLNSDITENIKGELIKQGLITKETVLFMAEKHLEPQTSNSVEKNATPDFVTETTVSKIIS